MDAELYSKTEVGRWDNWAVLATNLKRQGVEVLFKHKGQKEKSPRFEAMR